MMNINPISRYNQSALLPLVNSSISANTNIRKSIGLISSGLKIATSADSPSGLAMSERLRSLIGKYESAISNVENAVSYMETTDSYLQTVHNMTGRMQELAIAANDGKQTTAGNQQAAAAGNNVGQPVNRGFG